MMWENQDRPIRNLQKLHGQIICGNGCEKGPTPGLETPDPPDEPGELDAGDVVEGVGGGGLATGWRVRRVGQAIEVMMVYLIEL